MKLRVQISHFTYLADVKEVWYTLYRKLHIIKCYKMYNLWIRPLFFVFEIKKLISPVSSCKALSIQPSMQSSNQLQILKPSANVSQIQVKNRGLKDKYT